MRKFLFIGLMALAFAGCEKANELTQFNIDFTSAASIPASTSIGLPLDVQTPAIESDASSEFQNNGTNVDLVESIKLTELNLKILTPSDGDFNFLESIKVFITAEGLDEQQIASLSPVPQDTLQTIDLSADDVELLEYLKAEKFQLRVNVITDETIGEDHNVEIYTKFFVDAKLKK